MYRVEMETQETTMTINAGALVEIEQAPPTALPLDADAFDIALVDDAGGCIRGLPRVLSNQSQ